MLFRSIDPEEARQFCRVARFDDDQGEFVEFFVVDPVTLYWEKLALTQRRGSVSDHLHLDLIREYVRYEIALSAETLCNSKSLSDSKAALNFLERARSRAGELFQDARVRRRIEAALDIHASAINSLDSDFLRECLRSER